MNKKIEVDAKKIIFPKYNSVIAWLRVALWPWIVISGSWIFFLISVSFTFEVPASGAVLVCGALVSQVLYQNQRWTKMNTDPSGSFNLKEDGLNTGAPFIVGQFVMAPAGKGKLGNLLSLAKEHELRIESNGSEALWFYKDTVARVEIVMMSAILIIAVIGTAVWGYGHLYFGN